MLMESKTFRTNVVIPRIPPLEHVVRFVIVLNKFYLYYISVVLRSQDVRHTRLNGLNIDLNQMLDTPTLITTLITETIEKFTIKSRK